VCEGKILDSFTAQGRSTMIYQKKFSMKPRNDSLIMRQEIS